jgi:hypothetical protein
MRFEDMIRQRRMSRSDSAAHEARPSGRATRALAVVAAAIASVALIAAPQAHADGGVGVLGGFAVQDSNHLLTTQVSGTGTTHLNLGMMVGTSPSIASLSTTNNSNQVAFQANTGDLWTAGTLGTGDLFLGMMPNTNPSIVALNGSYEIAFQANTGTLWTTGTLGTHNWQLPMNHRSSPSMTVVNGTLEIAYQDSNNLLQVLSGNRVVFGLGFPMMPNTSPSIAALGTPGSPATGYEVAFQDLAGVLELTNGTSPATFTNRNMNIGSSPSITGIPGNRFQVAFEANDNSLWATGALGTGPLGQQMRPGTSPSIIGIEFSTSLPNPPGGIPGKYLAYDIAFQDNNGHLKHSTASAGTFTGTVDTGIVMYQASSPSNAPFQS